MDLQAFAAELAYAAGRGAIEAGAAGVAAGARALESAYRHTGQSVATTGGGELSASVAATQPLGVFQEDAPAVLRPGPAAGPMAEAAADAGVAVFR